MKPSTAIQKARKLSFLRFQGGQYIVGHYDPKAECWRESHPREYSQARAARSTLIREDAGELLGLDNSEAFNLSRQAENGYPDILPTWLYLAEKVAS